MPFLFIKYLSLGFFFFNIILITMILNSFLAFVRLIGKGFTWCFYIIYYIIKKMLFLIKSFFQYILKGFIIISYYIYYIIIKLLFLIESFFNYIFKGFIIISYYIYIILQKTYLLINKFIKYLFGGFIFLSFYVYLFLVSIFINGGLYFLKGIIVIYKLIVSFIKLIIKGFMFPFLVIINNYDKVIDKRKIIIIKYKEKKILKNKEREISKEKKRNEREYAKSKKMELALIKKRKKEEKFIKEAALREEKKKIKQERKEAYKNKDIIIEKKTFSVQLKELFEKINTFPKKLYKKIVNQYKNTIFMKDLRNKQDLERKALLIEFEGEDTKRSVVKVIYEYVAKDIDGKVIKDYFGAYSKVEVHSFLLSEGYEVYSIKTNKWINFVHGNASTNKTKIKTKDLLFFLTQLSTYIKAGIPLVESLKILIKQYKNKSYQRIFRSMVFDLTMGSNFSEALDKQGEAFPKLLINMIKAAEMTGHLSETLDDMAEYYTEIDKTRKQMVTALIYPSFVLVISIAVLTFIMIFIMPKFIEIYDSVDSDRIPGFTLFIMGLSNFMENNIVWLLVGFFVVLLVVSYLYNNVKLMRAFMQWVAMKTPGFGRIIIYNEVTVFTKTFSSLLAHNVFITDSMEVLNRLTNNEIYKMLILDTISNLARGEKISKAFQGHWAFPIPAYEMLVTGEKTGQLSEMMAKVSIYYQELHRNAVAQLKSLIEPVLIIFLTGIVGIIVLSIVIPMFDSLSLIQ